MRYALVNLTENLVANVVEIGEADGSNAPAGFLHVASETASIGDGWDGAAIVEKTRPTVQAKAQPVVR